MVLVYSNNSLLIIHGRGCQTKLWEEPTLKPVGLVTRVTIYMQIKLVLGLVTARLEAYAGSAASIRGHGRIKIRLCDTPTSGLLKRY